MQMPFFSQSLQMSQNSPFTYGMSGVNNSLTSKSSIPVFGCIMKNPNLINNESNNEINNDSEDDFPVCQAPLTKPNTTQNMPLNFTQCMQRQQTQPIKSNQMIFNHLKNMRSQVEHNNMMIDSLYQFLSQPHELNSKQLEQIYIQLNTLRMNVSNNNNSLSEIYKIISNHN
jgi:hypothetical protein